jgi:hypothetical protein
LEKNVSQGNQIGQQNSARLDALNAALNGLDLIAIQALSGKLDGINAKLGPQLPGGGISGFLKKTWDFLQIDRVLNILTWIGVLHNAYMLSNGVADTLFDMTSHVLAVFGIKDANDTPLDIQEIVKHWTEDFLKTLLGTENLNGIKETWKKYSRIYQAAANIVWALQSIGYNILDALEVIGSWSAKIGNALERWRVVGEKAFGWMNERPNFHVPGLTFLESVDDTASQIDMVALNVLDSQETFGNLDKQGQELRSAIGEVAGSKPGKETPEASVTKATEEASKTASASPAISPSDTNKAE